MTQKVVDHSRTKEKAHRGNFVKKKGGQPAWKKTTGDRRGGENSPGADGPDSFSYATC